ncbi:MAG: Flp family type IVb pilin [Nocardioides sp.]
MGRGRTACDTARPRALSERGASAVEYALLVAGIAAVVVLIIVALGLNVRDLFQDTCDAVAQGQSSCS